MSEQWSCPFCSGHATIDEEDVTTEVVGLTPNSCVGSRCLDVRYVVCPNPDCRQFVLDVHLSSYEEKIRNPALPLAPARRVHQSWRLVPPSAAKVFPNCVPEPILEDYREACLICDLSPKASATLARRCLQGMIRDFWIADIKPGKLSSEIRQLNSLVDSETWGAIDAVRMIGNIGAHMEKDINIIVDVDPEEASLLIGLIEYLVVEWYVARDDRSRHLRELAELAGKKETQRKQGEGSGPAGSAE